jgi:hypothetical protein
MNLGRQKVKGILNNNYYFQSLKSEFHESSTTKRNFSYTKLPEI